MALRGSRPIVVNSIKFRWVFSGKKDRWGNSPRTAHVAIQEEHPEGRPGKAMVAWISSHRWINSDAHDMDIGGQAHRAQVTPADVRLLIEEALAAGWNPSSKASHVAREGQVLSSYTTSLKPS